MKAILLCELGQIKLTEVPVPVPGPNQLLVKTGAAIICTSDLNDIRENPFGILLPVSIGHEGAGTVAAIGPGARGFQVGDRIATHPVHSCGTCSACTSGSTHLCLNMEHFGINLPGTMAEYYLVRTDRARLIPAAVSFPLAALAEPVCVCLEALAQARLLPGEKLLIIGDGPFGVMMARLASDMGLSRVVISGMEDFRLSFAQGAERVNVRGMPNPTEILMERAGGEGYDAAVLAVGSSAAFQQGMSCLKPKGRLVVFAGISGQTPVDLFSLHIKELEIIGACNDQDRFDEAVRLLADPRLHLAELITHAFPLNQYQEAFSLADTGKGQALKVAFTFEDQSP